ncbi:SET domain-containing protein [Aspergillus glaucus CBS 516.65]|uniref:SET domain-containing protein n=1 Tax=Aspergillus glaucus CBS 516.65 TaxID=1160497 RepID=A0A1L9VAB1_ASPGL|nr:hypothetical protein ASPGLDRAFT_50830 [Aspergillus glaucus CBS 516.65]OJJ80867.1 hypothetical protein ASPGLDRAFT_50830 [Aspergillus glaucus CBS 516.65]
MKREYLSIESLPVWARLNGVSVSGIAFKRLQSDGTDKGSAIIAEGKQDSSSKDVLLQIPSDLILSLEAVDTYAKSDRYLREVLEAVGGFGKTARGAILIFLLIQLSYSSPDFANESQRIGLSNPWTEYVKFMPPSIPLPTIYTDEELELLRGTSLASAVDAKLASLDREFTHLRESTDRISWCHKHWWDGETGRLTLEDWKYIDAVYRSRMVDLPGIGHSMVPCVDMANHAPENAAKARYDKDADGNAVLEQRGGRELSPNEEVTISYGDDKPALEMIFSYGFLEGERTDANSLVLDVDIPDDDPLKPAKKLYCKKPPGMRLNTAPGSEITTWDSSLVWWACVNEEDGLDFKVLQTTTGEKELRAVWNDEQLGDPDDLASLISIDPLWDVIQLRAVVLILERLETQLQTLRTTEKAIGEIRREEKEDNLRPTFRPEIFRTVSKLQQLEGELLERGIEDLTRKRQELLTSEVVISYLSQQAAEMGEDFS